MIVSRFIGCEPPVLIGGGVRYGVLRLLMVCFSVDPFVPLDWVAEVIEVLFG